MRVSGDDRTRVSTADRGSLRVPGRMRILPVPMPRRCAGAFAALALVLLAGPASAGSDAPSAVPNWSFEEAEVTIPGTGKNPDITAPGTPRLWKILRGDAREAGARTEGQHHDGKYSLRVASTATVNGAWRAWVAKEALPSEGRQWTLKVWVMCKSATAIPKFGLEYQPLDTTRAAPPPKMQPVTAGGSWTAVVLSDAVPEGMNGAWVLLELEGQGEAWFDDVWLGAGKPPGTGRGWLVLAKLAAILVMVGLIGGVAWGFILRRTRQPEVAPAGYSDLRGHAKHGTGAAADLGRQQFGIDPEVAERSRQVRELSEGATRMNKAVATWEWMREPSSINDLGRVEQAGREIARFGLFTGDQAVWGRVVGNPDGAHFVFREAFASCLHAATKANKERWEQLLEKPRRHTMGLDAGVVNARALIPRAEERVQKTEERATAWAEGDQALDAACATLAGVAAGAGVLAPARSAAEDAAAAAGRAAPEEGKDARWVPGASEDDQERWRSDVEARLHRLREASPAAPPEPPARMTCPALGERLPALVDRVEDVAYVVSTRGYRARHDEFVRLGAELRATVLPLLDAPEEDEAARHYHDALEELLDLFQGRLDRALQSVQDAKGGEGLRDATGVDLRVERLRARAEGLSSATDAYLADLAKPSVQQYLRPLITSLVRDFLSPLLEEAGPAGESGGSVLPAVEKKVRDVLRLTIHLEPVEPEVGQRVDDDRHEVIQVVDRTPGAESGTVAAVVQPGYLWADEVIARARVRSYR